MISRYIICENALLSDHIFRIYDIYTSNMAYSRYLERMFDFFRNSL
jgi:hypothetical protein